MKINNSRPRYAVRHQDACQFYPSQYEVYEIISDRLVKKFGYATEKGRNLAMNRANAFRNDLNLKERR